MQPWNHDFEERSDEFDKQFNEDFKKVGKIVAIALAVGGFVALSLLGLAAYVVIKLV